MKKKKDRQQIIYEIALGGVSAAMALLLVWLAVTVRVGTIGFYVAACCALLVPLTQKYYFPSIAAYVVSSLLAFAIVGDIFTIAGYVVYFAPMCIISSIMLEKKVKLYVTIPVKIVYINLALAFLYYVAGTVMISSDIIGEVPYWAVAIVGTVALMAIDFLMQYVYKVIKPRVAKALRLKSDGGNENVDNGSGDYFESHDENDDDRNDNGGDDVHNNDRNGSGNNNDDDTPFDDFK